MQSYLGLSFMDISLVVAHLSYFGEMRCISHRRPSGQKFKRNTNLVCRPVRAHSLITGSEYNLQVNQRPIKIIHLRKAGQDSAFIFSLSVPALFRNDSIINPSDRSGEVLASCGYQGNSCMKRHLMRPTYLFTLWSSLATSGFSYFSCHSFALSYSGPHWDRIIK